jgi:hypothetical protein
MFPEFGDPSRGVPRSGRTAGAAGRRAGCRTVPAPEQVSLWQMVPMCLMSQ